MSASRLLLYESKICGCSGYSAIWLTSFPAGTSFPSVFLKMRKEFDVTTAQTTQQKTENMLKCYTHMRRCLHQIKTSHLL